MTSDASSDQDASGTWRGLAVCGAATLGAILVGAVPALMIGLSAARFRYVEHWEPASSGLLEGERERALFVAWAGVLLALLTAVAVFRFVARAGRDTVPTPRVVAGCAVLVAASVLTVLVLAVLGSPAASGLVGGSVPAASGVIDPVHSV